MKAAALCAMLLFLARPVADSRYRPALERFTELSDAVAAELMLRPATVLPVDVPLLGYDAVAVGMVQLRPGGASFALLVRTFFLAEGDPTVWRVGILHEYCHVLMGHFVVGISMTDTAEREAEQCAYHFSPEDAYLDWHRFNLRRIGIIADPETLSDEVVREFVHVMLDVRFRKL